MMIMAWTDFFHRLWVNDSEGILQAQTLLLADDVKMVGLDTETKPATDKGN